MQVKVLEQAEPLDRTSFDFMLGTASSLTPVSPFVPCSLGNPFVPCILGIMPCRMWCVLQPCVVAEGANSADNFWTFLQPKLPH